VEQFALIGDYDRGHRYIKAHPLLRLLPVRWAETIMPKTKARITDIIFKKNNKNELGYIVDVPGFFVEEDKHKNLNRGAILDSLVEVLHKNQIRILLFPLWRKYMSLDEKRYLEDNSIILLDGSFTRLITLMSTMKKLLSILRAKPNEVEIGVWGADNRIGQLWVEFLAPHINYLVIGGHDTRALEQLNSRILYDTGLSCQITWDPNQCLDNKLIAILASFPQEWEIPDSSRIILLSCELSDEYLRIEKKDVGCIFIESGWIYLDPDFHISNDLNPWDRISILEASLFIEDKSYCNIVTNQTLSMKSMENLEEILMKHSSGSIGMVTNNRILTYDGFRRAYFRNCLDK